LTNIAVNSPSAIVSGGYSTFDRKGPKFQVMIDEPNIVLELLRAIRADIAEIKTDIVEVKERLGLLESQYASISRRLDRQGGDIERIKQRLELVDVH
jgi:hypothetical protein